MNRFTPRSQHLALAGAFILAAAVLSGPSWPLVSQAAEPPRVPIPSAEELAARVRKGHPRLLASADDFARLRTAVQTTEPLREWREKLERQAQDLWTASPARYEIPDGLRLLATSRRVLHRVTTLGLMYRLEQNPKHAERAWRELEAAAQFPDWNPRHFLDTAEMTHAFALGYDWLHDVWTPEQRQILRAAMTDKGLNLARDAYRGSTRYGGWIRARHNWNQVCNGGIGMGALALAEEAPELAGEILHGALTSLQIPMAEFAPDGAWNEGPGYWNYATSYNVVFLAALESALGSDFGLSGIPGFGETGLFPLYVTGPLGQTFNYADGGAGTIRAPQLFWLSRRFQQPACATYQRKVASPQPLDLLWFQPAPERATDLPRDKYFRAAEVVTMRSAWDEPKALFVGFKAGDNKANHSNLDLGTFVVDALGERWAVDLGADDYNLPGYFGGQRWTYYRLRAEGHNTLVLNPGPEPDQDPKALTRITRFESTPQHAFAIADLTPAYARQAANVERGVALLERRQVLVQDELQCAQPADLWWSLHTQAEVSIDAGGRVATLTRNGQRLEARLLAPTEAKFTVMEARPLPGAPQPAKQAENQGIRKLVVHLPTARDLRLTVLLTPTGLSVEPLAAPAVKALSDW